MRSIFLLFLLPLTLFAQPPQGQDEELSFSLGFAVLGNDEGYGDADDDPMVVPFADVRYKRFFFRGIQAGFDLVQSRQFTWKIQARPEFNGFEEDDSPLFTGMEDRDLAIMAGTALDFRFARRYTFSVVAETDVSGRNEGVVGELTLSRLFTSNRTAIIPSIGLNYQDDSFNDYYYGVRAEEVIPGRPFYSPDASLGAEAGLIVRHPLSEKLTFTLVTIWRNYPGEIKDSPLVDQSNSLFGLLGLSWKIR
jgi:outer membrane protein